MATWTPDPTLYASARMATQAPPEKLGYVAILHAEGTKPDALGVVDLDPRSSTYGTLVNRVPMPHAGDELHQHAEVERRARPASTSSLGRGC
jgi:methanethiol oxidase